MNRNLHIFYLIICIVWNCFSVEEISAQQFERITGMIVVTESANSRTANWGDYDSDGDLDLFVANADQSNFFYLNKGHGSFTKIIDSIIAKDGGKSQGSSWVDYDNDGDLDLFVANEQQNNFLYRSTAIDTFKRVGVLVASDQTASSQNGSWGDYDNDGDLDLFVVNNKEDNFLYRNEADGRFILITTGEPVTNQTSSLSSSWGDYDNDSDLDLFVVNNGQNNFLYRNDGEFGFTRITDGVVVNDGGRSQSASWGDYDNDGDVDLFVANDGGDNFLYRNDGQLQFAKITAGAIAQDGGNSRGSSWSDYDNDGDLDLIVANEDQNNFLYRNDGELGFTRIVDGTIVNDAGNSQGVSWGDYDNDGALDLVVANNGEGNFLYRNQGNNNHWLNLQCIGTVSNASGIGVKLFVKAKVKDNVPAQWQFREITAQTDQKSLNAVFGLGSSNEIDSLVIKWPAGTTQIETGLKSDQFVVIMENIPLNFLKANFGVNLTKGGSPLKIQFSDLSTSNPDQPITSWAWDFDDDGEIDSQERNPEWIYSQPGLYSARLTVSNGEVAIKARKDYIRALEFTNKSNEQVVSDTSNSQGSSWGDYDNDGDLDFFITNALEQDNLLYRNDGQIGFTKITTGIPVNDGGKSRSSSWGDYDNDGDLDLFVANNDENNFLYRNDGLGELVKATESVWNFIKITEGAIVNDGGLSRSANWGDYDNDDDLDLFVVNNGGSNFLYRNDGTDGFVKIIEGALVKDPSKARACGWGDYDNDGDLDLFVANSDGDNFLYRNNSDPEFNGVTQQNETDRFTKITDGTIVHDGGKSHSASWGDYDNDGDLDLFVANIKDNNFLYRNEGDSDSRGQATRFTKIITGVVVNDGGKSRSSSWGDYSNSRLCQNMHK